MVRFLSSAASNAVVGNHQQNDWETRVVPVLSSLNTVGECIDLDRFRLMYNTYTISSIILKNINK